jgi:cell division protein FtsB
VPPVFRSGRKSTAKAKRPPTRSERRRSHEARKARLILAGATVLSLVILAAWFPAGALYRQRASLNSATEQITQLHREDGALSQEHKNLSDSSEVDRIARQQYQLVSPGQQPYEILPPTGTATSNAPYASDPGSSAPVAPSAASELPPGTVTTTTLPVTGTQKADAARSAVHPADDSAAPSFLGRMEHALEFWR